jgi:putative spermidine/putrescine transport system ATP-binding protein
VAGFVGTSNLLGAALAKRLTGREETFSIRPEKIRLVSGDQQPTDNQYAVEGVVREVLYLGLYTRYQVEVAGNSDLLVIEQNLSGAPLEAQKARGRKVRLVWARQHMSPVTM